MRVEINYNNKECFKKFNLFNKRHSIILNLYWFTIILCDNKKMNRWNKYKKRLRNQAKERKAV